MIEIFYHSIYILFIFFAISSVAAGVILSKTRRSEDVLIFIACVVSAFALFTSAFFGYTSATDEHGKILSESEPLLSIYQTQWLHLIAALSFSAGFVIKACTLTKSRVHTGSWISLTTGSNRSLRSLGRAKARPLTKRYTHKEERRWAPSLAHLALTKDTSSI